MQVLSLRASVVPWAQQEPQLDWSRTWLITGSQAGQLTRESKLTGRVALAVDTFLWAESVHSGPRRSHEALDFLEGITGELVVGAGGLGGVHVVNILNMASQVYGGLGHEQVHDGLLSAEFKSIASTSWVIEVNLRGVGFGIVDSGLESWEQGIKLVELHVTSVCGMLNCDFANATDVVLFSKKFVDFASAGEG